ncbi:hypothetical protein GLOIN_2v1766738 [Rhizophagus clarus]|uniref:Uncharacterized protein n=1 Tax=Rhizophagus clarus TaxID=94130 RepID=A0A8H3QVE3_9GLOM|nr:hypothetical protein GLOIN_2v1766738 [Rhizophagus clarus]
MIENRIKYSITNAQEASENPSVIKAELMAMIMALLCLDKGTRLIRIKDLIVTLQKVKAHDSDDHSNVVDKLAKEACSNECLNRYFTSPSDLESFDWSLIFRYIKDKFDETSAFDFQFNSFKIKLRVEELPT